MNIEDVREDLDALAAEEGRRNPYPIYRRLRQRPPTYDERHHAYLITRYHDCVDALTKKAFGRPDSAWLDSRIPRWREHPGLVYASYTMQFANPENHPRLRASVAPFLTARRINSLADFESAAVDTLLDGLAEKLLGGAVVDLQEELADQMPSISIAALLGIPETEVRKFRQLSVALGWALEPGLTAERLTEIDDAYATLAAYFDGVIADRRRRPRDDFATHIVRCCDLYKSLTPEELTPMFLSIYGAGTLNTGNLLGHGIAAVLTTPSEAALLRSAPDLSAAAITEVMRYEAPMQVTRRIALADTALGGLDVPAGADLAIVLGAANRDPDVFPNPDEFRIKRDGPGPLSFGGGPSYCIGAALGRIEGALILRKLITRFPTLRIAGSTTHNLRSVLRGYVHIPVTLEASVRQPSPI